MDRTTTAVNKKITFSVGKKRSKNIGASSLKEQSVRIASSGFLRDRESLYHFVDLIDYLFDGVLG